MQEDRATETPAMTTRPETVTRSGRRSTLKRSRRKLAPALENVDQSNDVGSVTVTELNGLLKQIPSCGNCEEDDVSLWLDFDADDAGFQLMSDDEVIAQVRKPNNDVDNRESN
ncbi:hypothetical protein AVEN_63586-1 [Araneus ventricosus]|uniref:Uncharacterized protein n=1 Tax=Araneus ventricosus TaxID=182803 RepID=A0A4Y2U366_ARAVE|nr:hypothetical protein AVEN_63586-1 [Araneus ventricosus]